MAETTTASPVARPFAARQCPVCGTWVRCSLKSRGPGNDWRHYSTAHPDLLAADQADPRNIGFPYFQWNEEPVQLG